MGFNFRHSVSYDETKVTSLDQPALRPFLPHFQLELARAAAPVSVRV